MSSGKAMLAGQSVLVTGASSGLGDHFARLFARHGAKVAVAARRADVLAALKDELVAIGAPAVADVAIDVTDERSVATGVQDAAARLGALHVVVNNAGIAIPGDAISQPPDDFDKVLGTNLRGAWLVSQAAAQLWQKAGTGGSIINISSVLGLRPGAALAAYATSKAALIQLTRSHAVEWARYNIRVNALAPGYISTPLNEDYFASDAGKALIKRIPMRRLGRAEDLDGAILLLATEASSYMTGAVISIDGGHAFNAV